MNRNKIILVGTGYMATEYSRVLKALKKPFFVVGRGSKNALIFKEQTGIKAITGGIKKWLKENKDNISARAIVAVNENHLGSVTQDLIKAEVKSILVEKPGGMSLGDLKRTQRMASKKKAKVFIAYNRRFHTSTIKAEEYIKKDGGVTSFTFDFTELSHRIIKSKISSEIKKRWLLMNSSHVIDLAFYLGGKPKKIYSLSTRGISWHPKASIYAGAGISKKRALFSYHANWESAGRWGIEIMTPKRKLILRPLEKLQVQNIGSMAIEEISLEDKFDLEFKPGLCLMTKSFLGSKKGLPTLDEQIENAGYYNYINR